MMVTLNTMPDHARLWVYQANRKLSGDEISAIAVIAESFIRQWAAHGQALQAAFEIKFNQFLIISVDESVHGASGCSIDASVGMIRDLEQKFQVSFLDRTKVAILDNDEIQLVSLNGLKSLVGEGKVTPESKVFNNSVSTLEDWKKSWIQPASDSWMKRYFN